MGRAKKGKITKAASEARCYSLMAHDVTDIQVKEQNIIFIQYIQNTQVQFRFWPSTISQREPRCDGQEGLLRNKDRQEHIRRGPPVKLSARNGKQLVRAIQGLREKEGNFSCQRIMQEAGTSVKDVSVRTVSRFLNSQGYYYLQAHKKGVLTVTDMKKRLKFARRMRKDWSRRLD